MSVLVEVSEELLPQTRFSLVSALLQHLKLKGVYVSLAIPYGPLRDSLFQHDFDVSQVFVVDGTHRPAGMDLKGAPDVVLLNDGNSLSELSLAVVQATSAGAYDFLLFDSLDRLRCGNDPDQLARFVEYLAKRSHSMELSLVALLMGSALSPDAKIRVEAVFQKIIRVEG